MSKKLYQVTAVLWSHENVVGEYEAETIGEAVEKMRREHWTATEMDVVSVETEEQP